MGEAVSGGTVKLLHCPFCGSGMNSRSTEYEIDCDSYVEFVYAVVCTNCFARGPFTDQDDGTSEVRSKSAARKLWNERVDNKTA